MSIEPKIMVVALIILLILGVIAILMLKILSDFFDPQNVSGRKKG